MDWKPYEPAAKTAPKLIACPDCGQMISPRATACPHCGAPMRSSPPPPAVVDYLKKEKRAARGNTQGCGCLLLVLGLALAVLFPPLGGLLAIIGLVVLVVGLIR